MSKKKPTTRDSVQIDLDGSIDDAIAKLTELKAEYSDGEISLETDYEYGESYARLYLRFTRPKEPIEIEFEGWQAKLARLGELRAARRTIEAEGLDYPRKDEIAALEAELGEWGSANRFAGSLTIFDGEVLFHDMMRGAFRRDGTWVLRSMMADRFDVPAQGMETRQGEDANAASGEA
jgi:hypothetical protein